jgi:pyoverdine/dityrosine biosynthesis protein Dit1
MAEANGTNGTTSSSEAKAREILHVIEKYGLNYERSGTWDGFDTFLPIVQGQVSRKESIKMLLPGFPFKSPNAHTKVLGALPDLGEELALKRLDSMAVAVESVYDGGAEIHITSDGLVYNGLSLPSPSILAMLILREDLLGVPDETVWDFGQAVRAMADQHGLTHLSFLRLWDLLGNKGDFADKQYYLSHSDSIRAELLERFGDKAFEADMAGKSTADMHLTHTKYLEFLEQDLRFDSRHIKLDDEAKKANIAQTAKAMMYRWKAFSTALASVPTEYVRLSIHDSGGKDKLSMSLIPQREKGALGATPWHSTLCVGRDGGFEQYQREKVDQDKWEIVEREGRAYFWREKGSSGEGESGVGWVWVD